MDHNQPGAVQEDKANPEASHFTLPEWETPAPRKKKPLKAFRPSSNFKNRMSVALDRWLPPNRKYVGLDRRAFLWLLFCAAIVFLALLLGLSIGLSTSNRYVYVLGIWVGFSRR